ncbi:MAG: hypothetical protein CMJ78_05215 [Planctomycetaceae bacterium]|nr:hypothetical protein [Planctomycetaceae bacterium]
MRLLGCAQPWEFRYRLPILIASQPVFAVIVHLLTASRGPWYAPDFEIWVACLATTVAAFGIFIRLWSASILSAGIMGSRRPETSQLVTSGPFGIVRNPLYVGTMLIFTGYSLFFGWLPALLFFLFHAVRYQRMVQYEEYEFQQSTEQFSDYMASVPRFLPRRIPREKLHGPVFTRDALLSNALFLSIPIGMAVSSWIGTLVWLIPFELAGGMTTLLYFVITKPGISAELGTQTDQTALAQ